SVVFIFQAEDGIRVRTVTGVQTCALPIFQKLQAQFNQLPAADRLNLLNDTWALIEANRQPAAAYFDLLQSFHGEKTAAVWTQVQIGRASCRERGRSSAGDVDVQDKVEGIA